MKCYLCGNKTFNLRNSKTRDRAVRVLQCKKCTLTFLESFSHLNDFSYIDSQNNYEREVANRKDYNRLLKDLAPDDIRRVEQHAQLLRKKTVLDFGCGAGGFLLGAKKIAKRVVGVELDSITRFYNKQIDVFEKIEDVQEKFDIITLFHVVEHIPDPLSLLKKLKKYLKPGGTIIIEVPNDNDALITYYDIQAFRDFTYWSLHLYSFNQSTLLKLGKKAGFKRTCVGFFQRYSLGNHVGWLKNNKPGGHKVYLELEALALRDVYNGKLAQMGASDTLIAFLKI